MWNLAHEQRKLALLRCKPDRVFCSSAQQQKELTDLRAELPWLDDVPCDVAQATLKDLHQAWEDFWQGTKGRPEFKQKGKDAMGLCEGHRKAWKVVNRSGQDFLVFPKLGNLRIVLHRPLEGKATSATITRDGDAWFVSFHTALEIRDEDHAKVVAEQTKKPAVGIDRGVVNAFASSDGTLTPPPLGLSKTDNKIKKLQRELEKKQKKSNDADDVAANYNQGKNREKAKKKLVRAQRKLRRQRENSVHTWSYRYAKNHSVVVIEELKLKRMTRSAKGTVADPGSNVAAKAGLNRGLLRVGLGRFETLVAYKCERFGGRLVKVEPAYSSQECSGCGHIDAANRRSQSEFLCVRCGHREHADVNAAKVVLKRGLALLEEEANTRRTGGEEVCGGDPARGGPTKQKPKTVRSRTPKRAAKPKSSAVHRGDGLPALYQRRICRVVVPAAAGSRGPGARLLARPRSSGRPPARSQMKPGMTTKSVVAVRAGSRRRRAMSVRRGRLRAERRPLLALLPLALPSLSRGASLPRAQRRQVKGVRGAGSQQDSGEVAGNPHQPQFVRSFMRHRPSGWCLVACEPVGDLAA